MVEPHLRLDLLIIIIASYFVLMLLLTIERERYMCKYLRELKEKYVDDPSSGLADIPKLAHSKLRSVDSKVKSAV